MSESVLCGSKLRSLRRMDGGVTITRGDLTSPGPLQKAVYS
jgi:hypothetical protein